MFSSQSKKDRKRELRNRNSINYLCLFDAFVLAVVVGTGRGRWPGVDWTRVVLGFGWRGGGDGGIHGVE